MGQKGGKEASSSSSSSSSSTTPQSLDAGLSDDSSRSQLMVWAKSHGVGNAVLCYEAIHKRRNVYSSGKRCGDSEDALRDKLRRLGEALIEKYIAEDAQTPLEVQVDVESLKAVDTSLLEAFDGLADELKQHVEKLLHKKA